MWIDLGMRVVQPQFEQTSFHSEVTRRELLNLVLMKATFGVKTAGVLHPR